MGGVLFVVVVLINESSGVSVVVVALTLGLDVVSVDVV